MSNDELKRVYYNPNSTGSFGGVNRLRKATGKPKKEVVEWLKAQDAYTLHKPTRYRFPRRRTIVGGIKDQYQCDLIDVQNLKKENGGNGYILTCIDVFSKMGYARPIKNKTSRSIIPALKSIFAEAGLPRKLQSDKGGEFLSGPVQKYLKSKRIHHFTSQNEDIKAAIVERWNRTLKERLWRAFSRLDTTRFLELLPKLVKSYNNSYHRSIKRKPIEVTVENQADVWNTLYIGKSVKSVKSFLKIGDRVRITKARRPFDKGYRRKWSLELFTISRTLNTTPPTYVLKDDNGEELLGSFYSQEIQVVRDKTVFKIEKVLEERRNGREILVKWLGYPNSFNSWIPKSNLQPYKD